MPLQRQQVESTLLSGLLSCIHLLFSLYLFFLRLFRFLAFCLCSPRLAFSYGRYWIRRTIQHRQHRHHHERIRFDEKEFTRIPKHLTFTFAREQFEGEEDAGGSAEFATSPIIDQTTIEDITQLIQACVQISIPEMTLFDENDHFSSSWLSIAHHLALLQSPAPSSDPFASAILLLQGDPTRTDDTAFITRPTKVEQNQIIVVRSGKMHILDANQLCGDGEPTDDSAPSRWREKVIDLFPFVRSDASSTPPPTRIHLISFLGFRHGGQFLVDAAVGGRWNSVMGSSSRNENRSSIDDDNRLRSTSPPIRTNTPSTSIKSSQLLRRHLEETALSLPLSEPDMLIVVRRFASFVSHRSLQGTPSWLLRAAEIFFAHDADALVHGYELKERLQQFGKTVQRGGT